MVFTTQNTVKVTDTDLKPLNTVLASFTTEYNPGNESRTHNIQLASDKIMVHSLSQAHNSPLTML